MILTAAICGKPGATGRGHGYFRGTVSKTDYMRKIISIAIICLFALATQVNAQNKNRQDNKIMTEGINMQNGEVWVIKDGKKTKMATETMLTDGSRVMTNGNVTLKDGTTRTLHNGERISMDGRWTDNNGKDITDANRTNTDMNNTDINRVK